MTKLSLRLIQQAERHYNKWFSKTPIEYSKVLSDHLKTPTFFKLENMQPTGSYHLRCAHFAFSYLSEQEKSQGLALASDKDFALAFAYLCFVHHVKCHLYLTKPLAPFIEEKILGYHAKIIYSYSKKQAQIEAEKQRLTWALPPSSINYAASCAALVKEILKDIPQMSTLIAPNDKALLEGAQYYLSHLDPQYRLLTKELLKKRKPLSAKETIKWLIYHHQILIDEKGALTLAPFLTNPPYKIEGPVCFILTGRYLDPKILKTLF